MGTSDTKQTSGSRGTKIVRSTGQDASSYGDTKTKDISNDGFGGSRNDLSSSIKGNKVRDL